MKKEAKLYCPNPKDPTKGLRKKENGVWEKTEVIKGKRKSFSSLDPIDVWRKRSEYIAKSEIEEEENNAMKKYGPLFSTVADRYREQVFQMKHGTQKSYLPAIDRAVARFGSRRMEEVEPWEIKDFLKSLGAAKTTTSNQKTVLNAIYQLYIEDPEWHGSYNPSRLATLPRNLERSKRMPPSERQTEIVKQSVADPEALPAIVFLCTGERRGEACCIQLKDIDFDKNIITVNRAVEWISNRPSETCTKTDAGVRQIPLLQLLKQALEPHRGMPQSTYIIGLKDKPVTASWYARHWAAWWRKHGYAHEIVREKTRVRNGKEFRYHQTDWAADVCAHQFRHEYVCMLCEAGVPEEVAILLVGHANAKMIHEVYLALKQSMVENAGALLDKQLSK